MDKPFLDRVLQESRRRHMMERAGCGALLILMECDRADEVLSEYETQLSVTKQEDLL